MSYVDVNFLFGHFKLSIMLNPNHAHVILVISLLHRNEDMAKHYYTIITCTTNWCNINL